MNDPINYLLMRGGGGGVIFNVTGICPAMVLGSIPKLVGNNLHLATMHANLWSGLLDHHALICIWLKFNFHQMK